MITFDPWRVRAYIIQESCWKTNALTELMKSCSNVPLGKKL
jgi:hypothetical protein